MPVTVSCRSPVPAQSMAKISVWFTALPPVRSPFDWNAIVVPSGDQSGAPSFPGSVVTWVAVPPVAGMIQMS